MGAFMGNTTDKFAAFKLTDELRTLFLNFETAWGAKETPVNPYKIITVVNSDVTGSEAKNIGGA